MKKYSKVTEPKELDFFSIEEDGKGGKQIHCLGYTYYGDEWHNIEVCWFIEPLKEFIAHVAENEDYYNEQLSEYKQYESDNTEEEIVAICNEYYDGKEPDYYLDFTEISEDTPCGNYVSGSYTDEEYVHDLFGNEIGEANAWLKDYGMEVVVEFTDGEDGFYSVGYRKVGTDDTEWYVENDFEHEVAQDIITCIALAKQKAETGIKSLYCVTYVGLSDSEYDANGYSNVYLYDDLDKAKAKLKQLKKEEFENIRQMGQDYELLEDEDDEVRISWCAHGEQVRIEVKPVVLNQ